MSDQEVTYSTLRFLQSPSESQNRLRPDGTQRPDKTEQKESSVPWHGIAVTLGILCLLLLMTITVLGIKIFQYIQENHQQEETLRNLSQKYDATQNDNYLKKQLLTKKTSECDRLNETFQQMKGSDLVFTEKKGCYHENESSESLPNTDMMEKRVYTEVKSLGKRKRMQSRTADIKYEGVMMRTDFVPLYFPENNGKKMEYMTVTLATPDRQTGKTFEESRKFCTNQGSHLLKIEDEDEQVSYDEEKY
ncbi:hypothetical protein MJT46_002153 [Ovis ammon polii x Ovis aries]|nr:hypothetical protein MJT46_002153 [Ovis ammon polii x Ovis aries]